MVAMCTTTMCLDALPKCCRATGSRNRKNFTFAGECFVCLLFLFVFPNTNYVRSSPTTLCCSTDIPRTMQSGFSLFYGLYNATSPTLSNNMHKFDVHTMDIDVETSALRVRTVACLTHKMMCPARVCSDSQPQRLSGVGALAERRRQFARLRDV